jgi:hypothetical protein
MTTVLNGFKVVWLNKSSKLHSFVSLGTVEYHIGEWVEPQSGFGPLTVFDNLESAVYFATKQLVYSDGNRVFTCEYVESAESEVWFLDDSNEILHSDSDFSASTVLASKVRLLEDVTP